MLESLINSVLNGDGSSGDSTVVALHCQQMREWGVRGGKVEFRPVQDTPKNDRLKFIQKVFEDNQLSQRLDFCMDNITCWGEICWFFLPDPLNRGYVIDFYVGGEDNPNPEFKAYYAPGGRTLDKVIIIYSYDLDSPYGVRQKRWVKLTLTADYIDQSESSSKLTFNQLNANYGAPAFGYGEYGGDSQAHRWPNPFAPNIPVEISQNKHRRSGQRGKGDFHSLQTLIETHEVLASAAHSNLATFANPSMVTTRSAQEVLETTRSAIPNTWAGQNRYVDNSGSLTSGSTNALDSPSWNMSRSPTGWIGGGFSAGEGKIAKIIGGVGEGERFGYIQADPVSGDQNMWIKQLRELIHWCLGGVDPLGISSGATFGEIKTLFGRVQNTADKKAESLYKFGLCRVFERLIEAEEKLYQVSLFMTLKKYFPPETFKGLEEPKQLDDSKCQQIADMAAQGILNLPPTLEGLMPLGDRSVIWRYTRQVFQMTTREELDLSIAGRNAREDGLSQEYVLRKQYPDMTDQEIRNAMSGFSPRVVDAAAQAIQQVLQIHGQLMQVPDPQNPKIPWAMTLGTADLIKQAVTTLQKEIAYGQPVYEPDAKTERPSNDLRKMVFANTTQDGLPVHELPTAPGAIVDPSNAFLPQYPRPLSWQANSQRQ